MSKTNILLLSMVEDFKKEVGKTLSKELGMFFADVLDIVNYENTNLEELVKIKGDEFYLGVIKKTLNACIGFKNAVISVGDLLAVTNEILEKAKQTCLVVFLDVDKDLYIEKQKQQKFEHNEKFKLNNLMFEERNGLLKNSSDVIVKVDEFDAQKVAQKIVKTLKKQYGV